MILYKKIREERTLAGMTMSELARKLGVTQRCIAYYESGQRTPSPDIISQLCDLFHKPYEHFVSVEDNFIIQATQSFGSRGKKQAEKLILEADALFAGGELNEKDRELFMQAMESIFTDSKERAKKYTPKKYLKD